MEEQHRIFGEPFEEVDDHAKNAQRTQQRPASNSASNDLRSPRKQMFSDLPTPAYNQTTFHNDNDTGMVPVNPTYNTNYQMVPQGDGEFASLNDALRSPTVYTTTGMGAPTLRDVKSKRRESAMLGAGGIGTMQKKTSMSRLREGQEGISF